MGIEVMDGYSDLYDQLVDTNPLRLRDMMYERDAEIRRLRQQIEAGRTTTQRSDVSAATNDGIVGAAVSLLANFDVLWNWMVKYEPGRTTKPGWVAVNDACVSLRSAIDDCLSDPLAQGEGKKRNDHPHTSRKAAFDVMPRSGTQRWIVLDAIARSRDGMTDEEIQIGLDMNPNTQRPRRVELVEWNWIKDSGVVRLTKEGKEAIVWTLTNAARLRLTA